MLCIVFTKNFQFGLWHNLNIVPNKKTEVIRI